MSNIVKFLSVLFCRQFSNLINLCLSNVSFHAKLGPEARDFFFIKTSARLR